MTESPSEVTQPSTPVASTNDATSATPATPTETAPVATEATPAAPAATEAPKPPEAPKQRESYSQIMREKNKLRKEQEALKAERARIEQQARELAEAEKDPWQFLNKKGYTYEKLIDKIVKGEQPEEKKPEPNPEVEAVKRELDQIKQNRNREIWNNHTNKVADYINANDKDGRWELLQGTNSYEKVVETIVEKYRIDKSRGVEQPEELSFDAAADMVERYLEEVLSKDLDQVMRLKKIRAKFELDGKKNAEPKPAEVTKEPEVKPADNEVKASGDDWEKVIEERKKNLRAITNSNTAPVATGETKPLSREDRINLALQKYGGKLFQ